MNNEKLKELIQRVPWQAMLIAFLALQAWGYYEFTNSPESPWIQKRVQISEGKKEVVALGAKLKVAQEFFRTLDQKRAEIRALTKELDEMRNALTEELNLPEFIKLVATEAKKLGVNVTSIKPTASKAYEYYFEQAFDLNFSCVYVQLVVFLERIASLEKIVRIDDLLIRRTGPSTSRYVELGGTLQLKAYKYLGSKADEVARAGGSDVKSTAPGAPPKPGAGK